VQRLSQHLALFGPSDAGLTNDCPPGNGVGEDLQPSLGHRRAISPGVAGLMAVTSDTSTAQVKAVRGLDLSDSQADSAGSIVDCDRGSQHKK